MPLSTTAPVIPAIRSPLSQKLAGDIRGTFHIAGYQRGYRWGKEEVCHLLNDIRASGGKRYSLQPVVVKLRQDAVSESDQEWELIDGQQRLTTLYLILRYMDQQLRVGFGPAYSLCYETRSDSRVYLESISVGAAVTARNIDYHHLQGAYVAIDAWFAQHGDRHKQYSVALDLYRYLSDSIGLIWYEAPSGMEAIPLFTRLNVGRIPLTAAELVKAALLTAVREKAPDRAFEVAAQWDAIERDLQDQDIWAFVAGQGIDALDEKYPTRISLLLDANADAIRAASARHDRYHTFDVLQPLIDANWEAFWNTVVALHAQILGWYRLPDIYNKIGFLVAAGISFGKFVHGVQRMRKTEFEAFLVGEIRALVATKEDALEELQYGAKSAELMHLLLLLNVETASRSGHRFPFARHMGPTWSLEHIHAQQPEGLNKADQWSTWLLTHRQALQSMVTTKGAAVVNALDVRIGAALDGIASGRPGAFSGSHFNILSQEILTILDDKQEADHGIRNLALLASSHNSRLNNSVFEVKRQMILQLDREGDYVPQCTRNVFLKYYADADAQQPHFWSEQDKAAYMCEIRQVLKPYLT
jgi:hypothetical protein